METEQLFNSYANGYNLVSQAISGLSEEEISYKPAPDSWSIHEIIIHLADSDIVGIHRMKKVLAETDPLLTAYDQDLWANNTHYARLDYKQHLALFKLLRESFVSLLGHVTENDLLRTGIHSEAGKLTLKQLLENYIKHVSTHVQQIERVKQAYSSNM
ncbi:MAG TPA: DinB family protein [Bacilli bacterium]